MSDFADAATRWVAQSKQRATAAVARQTAEAAARQALLQDWNTIRPKIVSAVQSINSDLGSATVGTIGGADFGTFSISVNPRTMVDGIELVVSCSNPKMSAIIQIRVRDDGSVLFALIHTSVGPIQSLDSLKVDGAVDAAVRSVVLSVLT